MLQSMQEETPSFAIANATTVIARHTRNGRVRALNASAADRATS